MPSFPPPLISFIISIVFDCESDRKGRSVILNRHLRIKQKTPFILHPLFDVIMPRREVGLEKRSHFFSAQGPGEESFFSSPSTRHGRVEEGVFPLRLLGRAE